jgi:hypothetical protein
MRDHLRSIPASVFLQIADVPGLQFHSLQHRVRDHDLPDLDKRPSIAREVERALDLADTAALIDGLDLVITVDTAIAHLSAAMGKPVWVLLHSTPDWRWQTERLDSPWYPTMRLFRLEPSEWIDRARRSSRRPLGGRENAAPDDMGWQPLVRRVCRALRAMRTQEQA